MHHTTATNEEIITLLQQRRDAFSRLCAKLWDYRNDACALFNQCPCPVCGYPTLSERSYYDMCYLCAWEDDGQDDDNADEPSVPNGGYTLTRARLNFFHHGSMYDQNDEYGIRWLKKYAARIRACMALYDALLCVQNTKERAELIAAIRKLDGCPAL